MGLNLPSSNTAFARILLRVCGLASLRAASSTILLLTIVGSVLIGQHALQFYELGELLERNSRFRVTAVCLWVLAMGPALSAGLRVEGLSYLRGLGMPESLGSAFVLGMLVSFQGLIALPLMAAGLALPAAAVGLSAMAGGACLLGLSLRPSDRALGTALAYRALGTALAYRALGTALAGGIGILLYLKFWTPVVFLNLASISWALPRIWKSATEPSSRRRRRALGYWNHPRIALLRSQMALLWRQERVLMLRALTSAALGVLLAQLVRRANASPLSIEAMLVAMTPALAATSLMLALPLKRARQQLAWLMRSVGVFLRHERTESMVLVSAANALLALASSVAAGASSSSLLLALIYSFGWSALAIRLSSRAQEAIHAASLTTAIALAAMLTIGLAGAGGLVALLGLAVALAAGPIVLRELGDA